MESNDQRFLMTHRNGYLMSLKKHAKRYNSMAYGQAALVVIEA
jgi:hypothetical protein